MGRVCVRWFETETNISYMPYPTPDRPKCLTHTLHDYLWDRNMLFLQTRNLKLSTFLGPSFQSWFQNWSALAWTKLCKMTQESYSPCLPGTPTQLRRVHCGTPVQNSVPGLNVRKGLLIKLKNWNWQDGSGGKGICCQAYWPEFSLQSPREENRLAKLSSNRNTHCNTDIPSSLITE